MEFVRNLRQDEHKLIVELNDTTADRPNLIASIVAIGGKVLSVYETEHPLEEIYLKLIKEDENNDT